MVIRFTALHFKVGQDQSRPMGLCERVAFVGGRQKAKGLYSDNLNSARSLSNASYIFDKTSTLHLGPPPRLLFLALEVLEKISFLSARVIPHMPQESDSFEDDSQLWEPGHLSSAISSYDHFLVLSWRMLKLTIREKVARV